MSATTVKQRQPGDQEDQVAHPHRPGGVDDARLALRHAEHDDGVIDQDDRKKTRQKVGQHLATGLGDGQGRTDQYEEETTAGKGDPTVHFCSESCAGRMRLAKRFVARLGCEPAGEVPSGQTESGRNRPVFFDGGALS